MWLWLSMVWMVFAPAQGAEVVDPTPWEAPSAEERPPLPPPAAPAAPAMPTRLALQRTRTAATLLWTGAGVSLAAVGFGYLGLMLGSTFGLLGQPVPMYVCLGAAAVTGIAGPVLIFLAAERVAAVSPAIVQRYSGLRYASLGLLGLGAALAYLGYTQLATGIRVGAETPTVVGLFAMTGAVLCFGGSVATGTIGSALTVYKSKRAHRRAQVVVAPTLLREGGGLVLAGAF